ncbi:MAG: DUF6069 family protein [Acidimicrobiales bacterium]
MSNATSFSDTAAKDNPSLLTSTIPRGTAWAGVLAAAATTAGAAVLRTAGVPLAVHGEIPLAGFAQNTLIGAVIGGVLLAVLNRHSSDPHRRFIQVAIGLTALSCVAPVALADTMASKVALIALHLVGAAIIVPVLARCAR